MAYAVVSALLERPVSLEVARRDVSVDRLGRTSMQELLQGFEARGAAAAGVRLTADELCRLKSPVVLFVRGNHFLVALGGRDDNCDGVVVVDIPEDPRILRADQLEQELSWQGEALIVAASEAELRADLERVGLAVP